ncbi:MAG: hypothetical protein U1D41_15820 [Nitrosomonas sp.]|uniref:hypothetical protein n=1 Tax=Nitrosomonas sp. TaxID=42353 RepID=UPI00272F750C|nr:hypothetical protein [Nitrosomonas sp.]MDP1786195.1 hypothetical protein [Nitrosomonas sp.]MDP2224507.1 hypothetical protein [Nitrosomonas sp.]MDP3661864.1 hypothetical protein [Nitrosomonas sp.]MDZ4107591.1 hypothetical protein [Nitrosomonas sp.]
MMEYKDLLQILHRNYTEYRVSRLTGILSLLFILSGCQTILSPEQATKTFWTAMANGELESAKKYSTRETQYLVIKQENLIGTSLETGVIVINGPIAKVATVIALKNNENNKILSFDTVLLKENDVWKVDYRQTLNNFSILPFGEVLNSLRAIGDVINKKLEQQMPFFDNQIRSFSDELIRQLDEFRHQLEKANPTEKL